MNGIVFGLLCWCRADAIIFFSIFWRHFALWWLAVSDTPQFLRDQAELQEQLALLLCTVAKEVPSVLVASGLVGSSPLTCSAIASAVTLLAQSAAGAGDDSGASGDTGAGTVFICLLQQLQQRLPTEQATRQELAASFSEGKGVLASGLVHADMRNVFLAVLRESLQLTRHGSAELREGLNPATASGRAVAAFLLYCCCPSSATNAGAATYAIQAWTHLIQHGFQTPALFAPLREVLGLSYSSGVFTQGEIAQSEDAGQQRGDGIDLVLQVIPVREVLACTSSLLLELDVANDAQQVRVRFLGSRSFPFVLRSSRKGLVVLVVSFVSLVFGVYSEFASESLGFPCEAACCLFHRSGICLTRGSEVCSRVP